MLKVLKIFEHVFSIFPLPHALCFPAFILPHNAHGLEGYFGLHSSFIVLSMEFCQKNEGNACVCRESNPGLLLGRQLS